MLGLGKWKFSINMFLYKGVFYLNIEDNNGKYKITPIADGLKADEIVYKVSKVVEEGNKLYAEIESELIPGNKTISGCLTFNGDRCSIAADVPILGHLEVKDGIKVS